MPNKTSAIEWLRIAYHDLLSATILYDAEHFTDSIGNDLQQSIEKILKSISVYESAPIKKSHDLLEIYGSVKEAFTLSSEELTCLECATEYFKEDRYPNPYYSLPPREEIKEVLDFTNTLFERVCGVLDISIDEIKAK
jgi:HEPN domain-containing protein